MSTKYEALNKPVWSKIITSQEAMENFVFPDEIETKFMEANCFVKKCLIFNF